jgi:hypothetical protein
MPYCQAVFKTRPLVSRALSYTERYQTTAKRKVKESQYRGTVLRTEKVVGECCWGVRTEGNGVISSHPARNVGIFTMNSLDVSN